MSQFQCIEKISIPTERGTAYGGMAFDGCHTYFLRTCAPVVMETDACFACTRKYETCRVYSCFCYDFKAHCFWATARSCCNQVFQLNRCFQEMDAIPLCGGHGTVMGLSYNCCTDSLQLAFADGIATLEKDGTLHETIASTSCLTGVCSLCPGTIVSALQNGNAALLIYGNNNQLVYTETLPDGYMIKDILFNPCHPCAAHCKGVILDLLVSKKCRYTYVLRLELNQRQLGFCPASCNYHICQESCPTPSCAGRANLMESIALMETALSHILNAEGEKLQKVLASTDDVNQILCVNKEINRTLIHATHLEHALYAKLSAIADCDGDCGIGQPEPDCTAAPDCDCDIF
ncbi:MAG: hypothetical protein RR336_08085 [Oscillospiraceae bacterium]